VRLPVRYACTPVALALLLAPGGCDARHDAAAAGDGQAEPAQAGRDFGRLAPGDTVLGLGVVAVEVAPESVDSFGWMGSVRFSGRVELSGNFRPHPEFPDVRELCFYPDAPSAARLPRFPNDARTSWLCFANQEEAQRRLGALPAAGSATVVVEDFDYIYRHTDVYNRARLVSVAGRGPVSRSRTPPGASGSSSPGPPPRRGTSPPA
jgi:hypothetical protein